MGQGRLEWMPFSPADFVADPEVGMLTWEERGRYVWALCFSWLSKTPGRATPNQWLRWMGYAPGEADEQRERYVTLFEPDGELWVQKRMALEHEKALAISEKRSEMGRHASEMRWAMRTASGPDTVRNPDRMLQQQKPIKASVANARTGACAPERAGAVYIDPDFSLPSLTKPWCPNEEQRLHLQQAYPGTNLKAEFAKMRVWLETNPTRMKTLRGLPRFANAWLGRAQDSGIAPPSPPKPSPWDQEPRRA